MTVPLTELCYTLVFIKFPHRSAPHTSELLEDNVFVTIAHLVCSRNKRHLSIAKVEMF